MKSINVSSLVRHSVGFAILALSLPVIAHAQKNSGTPTGPTVIPGGTVTTTYNITAPGSYVLGGNRLMSDSTFPVVHISAPDVTLDLNGFSLSHPSGSKSQAAGLWIESVENVEVRHGTIADAAHEGIHASGTGKGLRLIDVRVVSSAADGIFSETPDTKIASCVIEDSGTNGIWCSGANSLVEDCMVTGSVLRGITIGQRSRLLHTIVNGGSIGIYVDNSFATVADCTVTGTLQGIRTNNRTTLRNCEVLDNSTGIWFLNANGVAIGNHVAGNTTNIQGTYTNGGGNVIQ